MADAAPATGGSSTGLYLGIGIVALITIGGGYMFFKSKPSAAKGAAGATGTGTGGNTTGPATGTASGGGAAAGATAGGSAAGATAAPSDYVDADAITKRNSEAFNPYSDTPPDNTAYMTAIGTALNLNPNIKKHTSKKQRAKRQADSTTAINNAEPYVRGFMKGMNLALQPDYVAIYGAWIQDYMKNNAKLAGNLVTPGQFLQ